jgi:hypothetical protein
LLHLVAFYSQKLTSAEINYQVYDKKTPANHHDIRAVETVSCRSSALSPSSNKSQESPVFHDYLDLESSPGTLVYLPS